ncbi:MAG: UDP-N-acetylglucosamine 1-carboxyvinyltransferase [Candidatus Vogelbacteria bacterium]|nr:UDP-N-acetylglucosamine 1-carboxyvinyltransferase [Candidatus Vogelbacteria bacterium]
MKEALVIQGLDGKKTLAGSININGAKNAALQAFAMSLLFKDEVILKNVPEIEDVKNMVEILKSLGVKVERKSKGVYAIKTPKKISTNLPEEISKKFRASIVLSGPILARFGSVGFPHPGGCVIGLRPIDVFLNGFEKFGVKIKESENGYLIRSDQKLKGSKIFLRIPSVTGAQTLMMAALLARGKTIIKNAPLEPETKNLADFMNLCGAKIKGAGTSTIEIIGTGPFSADGKVFVTPPDRIEAGSFIILGAVAGNRLEIKNCNPEDFESLLETLKYCGVNIEVSKNKVVVMGNKSDNYNSTDIKTHEYPGFPTDLQAPMTVFLTQAEGEGLIFETIFEGRLNYTSELVRMGADVRLWDPHRATVKGPTPLRGREVESPDIRAGLAFIIAAIIANGESIIHNVHYIDRGYEKIEDRLRKIGADIKRVSI